ncbi:MAG: septal ring lytic transglycosylase RlpA family protein [Gemmatimonadaceae bacterium]|nr:septal ring lytic transglycosylase RlpA family protein [Chitinophagaceae bacterium]
MRNHLAGVVFLCLFFAMPALAQNKLRPISNTKETIQYGVASYYANKFQGRQTANGDIFDQQKLTCAHNSLPFNTWIRVTNLRNGKTIVVRVTDRLHHKNKRLVDLSLRAASRLGYTKRGLTRVKVEVLDKKPPEA